MNIDSINIGEPREQLSVGQTSQSDKAMIGTTSFCTRAGQQPTR